MIYYYMLKKFFTVNEAFFVQLKHKKFQISSIYHYSGLIIDAHKMFYVKEICLSLLIKPFLLLLYIIYDFYSV